MPEDAKDGFEEGLLVPSTRYDLEDLMRRLTATLDRSFADEMWSKDGMISRAAWDTGKAW